MPRVISYRPGWIEAIVGPMFSGKSDELIKRLTLSTIGTGAKSVWAFKPKIDSRFSDTAIASRTGAKIESILLDLDDYENILHKSNFEYVDVIGFDEVQFYDSKLVKICNDLADMGKRVIVSGLDTDYEGKPFETTVSLMCSAEYVDKMLAVCVYCGEPAIHTYRTTKDDSRIVVGDTEVYEARCRRCFKEEHYE
jgi:thymidine kinase